MKKDNYTLRTAFLLLLACIGSNLLMAQNAEYEWVKAIGGSGFDFSNDIETDDDGNIYSTGIFSGTVDFDPRSGSALTVDNIRDAYILKLNKFRRAVWVKKLGGTGITEGKHILVDDTGNVYTYGQFYGTTDFDPGPGTFNLTSSSTANDVFISKLDASGNFLWAKKFGSAEEEVAGGIQLDEAGNLYISGRFTNFTSFTPGSSTGSLTSNGGYDGFIAKLDNSGTLIWAKNLGGSLSDAVTHTVIDAIGNVFFTGYFSGTADFDPGSGVSNLTSLGSSNAFVSKLDASGNFIWAKSFEGTAASSGSSLTLDTDENIYLTGSFRDTINFSQSVGISDLVSEGSLDVFTLKLDASGDIIWAKSIGGKNIDVPFSIDCDADGNVYTVGQFRDTVDFDPGNGTAIEKSNGNFDAFVMKSDGNGELVWAKTYGGTGHDLNSGIKIADNGSLYLTGSFSTTVDFDPGSGISNFNSEGSYDIFIMKLGCTNDVSTSKAGNIIKANALGVKYQWIDCDKNSPITGATDQSYTATANGNYAVIVSSGCTDTSDCVNIATASIKDRNRAVNAYPLYPNPTTSQVTISNFISTIEQVTVLDITGKTLQSFIPVSATIDLSSYPKGIYFITLQDGETISTQKVIKH